MGQIQGQDIERYRLKGGILELQPVCQPRLFVPGISSLTARIIARLHCATEKISYISGWVLVSRLNFVN